MSTQFSKMNLVKLLISLIWWVTWWS